MLKIKKTLLLALLTFLSASNIQPAKPKKSHKAGQKTQAERLAKNRKTKKQKIKQQEESSYLSWILGGGALILGGVLLFVFWPKKEQEAATPVKIFPNPKNKAQELVNDTNQKTIQQDAIITEMNIIAHDQLADNIQVTELNLADLEIFKKLGHKPEDVLLVNAANFEIGFGWGGINGAISKLVTSHTGLHNWGPIKDIKDQKVKNAGEVFQKGELEVGSVFITTAHALGKPTIHIAHIFGPNGENTPELQEKVRKAYEEVVGYAHTHKKHLVCCTISTGIYCKDDQMFSDMSKACWQGINNVYNDTSSDLNSITTKVYLNMWHREIIKNIPNKKLAT